MPSTPTREEKDVRRQERIERAAQAAEALRSSDGWQRWLQTRRRFRTYSLRNQLIIALEMPEARFVAGFKKWISLGYCVRKGEHATYIWTPMPPSRKQLAEWEAAGKPSPKPRTRFSLAPVFGDHQVDPIDGAEQLPLNPPVQWGHVREDGTVDLFAAESALRLLALDLGIGLCEKPPPGVLPGARGCWVPATRQLWVRAELDVADRIKTTIHELGHALLDLEPQDGDPDLDRASEELVVESTAFAVVTALGLDASDCSIPYLAGWARESTATDAILAHAQLIHRLAARIEDALATGEADDKEPS